MKKLLLLFVLCAVLVTTVAVALTPQEVIRKDGKRIGAFECSQKQVMKVIEATEDNWVIILNALNGKIVMMEGDEEGNVIRVVFGMVTLEGKESRLKLEIYSEMNVEDAMKYFPDPCTFLTSKEI